VTRAVALFVARAAFAAAVSSRIHKRRAGAVALGVLAGAPGHWPDDALSRVASSAPSGSRFPREVIDVGFAHAAHDQPRGHGALLAARGERCEGGLGDLRVADPLSELVIEHGAWVADRCPRVLVDRGDRRGARRCLVGRSRRSERRPGQWRR
jgi:hypothetical protein